MVYINLDQIQCSGGEDNKQLIIALIQKDFECATHLMVKGASFLHTQITNDVIISEEPLRITLVQGSLIFNIRRLNDGPEILIWLGENGIDRYAEKICTLGWLKQHGYENPSTNVRPISRAGQHYRAPLSEKTMNNLP